MPTNPVILFREMRWLLDNQRGVQDRAPLGSSFSMIEATAATMDANRASPLLVELLDKATQALEHCPGSEGLKRKALESVRLNFVFGRGTDQIMELLEEGRLLEPDKIAAYERELWAADACVAFTRIFAGDSGYILETTSLEHLAEMLLAMMQDGRGGMVSAARMAEVSPETLHAWRHPFLLELVPGLLRWEEEYRKWYEADSMGECSQAASALATWHALYAG